MVSGAGANVLFAAAIVLTVIAVLLVAASLRIQRRIRRVVGVVRGASGNEILVALRRNADDLDAFEDALTDLQARLDDVESRLVLCTSRVSLMRYDAFPDMGGKLSFSLALLDEQGDGVVLSVINGRSEARTYGKRISAGSSRHNLSAEEIEVVRRALTLDRRRVSQANGKGGSGRLS